MKNRFFKYFRISPTFICITIVLLSVSVFAVEPTIGNPPDDSALKLAYSERLDSWMRHSYISSNSDFTSAFKTSESFPYTSTSIIKVPEFPVTKSETPSVGNISEYTSDNIPEEEKILVVMIDAYGIQNYSKVVITDVDMEQSILIAKDIFAKFPQGVYTVVASSANDLVSQKLIIQ